MVTLSVIVVPNADCLLCDNCNKQGFDLKKCLGCHSVHYCSKNCQIQAWIKHKTYCLDKQNKHEQLHNFSNLFRNMFDNCTFCGKLVSDPLLKRDCPQCLKAVYCTRYCLAKDWSNHMLICEQSTSNKLKVNKSTKDPITEENGSTAKSCNTCGNVKNLKSCSSCKKVYYCSKNCQRSDWKTHKNNCSLETKPSNYKSDTMRNKIELEKKLRDMRIQAIKDNNEFNRSTKYKHKMAFGNFDDEALLYDDHADITIVKQPYPGSWENITKKAMLDFPDHCILTLMDKVPHETSRLAKPPLLVAFIPRYHHYRGRHCVYIEDACGTELYIAFYFKTKQFPYFQWSEIKPGRFIFIKHPRIHNFADSSVGFRLESPNDFILVDV